MMERSAAVKFGERRLWIVRHMNRKVSTLFVSHKLAI